MQATSRRAIDHRVGYGLDLGKTNWRSFATGHLVNEDVCVPYGSIYDVLDRDFHDRGFLPGVAVLAVPGTEINGKIQPTQLPWEPFTEEELSERYDIKVVIINDLQAAQLGATTEDRERLTALYSGRGGFNPKRHLCVLTLSSGINWTTGTYDTVLPFAREGGHIGLAAPTKGRVADLIAYVSDRMRARASIEDLLSGNRGIDHVVGYLRENGLRFPTKYYEEFIGAAESGKTGELMTREAIKGNPLWGQVGLLYGELLGYLINQIVIADLVGELFIQGAGLNDTPGFAAWLFKYSPIREIMVGLDTKMEQIVREVSIYGVPSNVHMAARGAGLLASSLLD
jgi:hypothetical protein